MALFLRDILEIRDVDITERIKVVRHQDSRRDVHLLYRMGLIEVYQAIQSRPVFDDAEYIVSFLGIENVQAQFIGFYRNVGRRHVSDLPSKPDHELLGEVRDDFYWYDLEPIPVLDDLKERLIIKWGAPPSARSWVQAKLDKEIVEIRPEGYVKPFPGYQDFLLMYSELVELIENPDANREWLNKLSAVGGVYLIVDIATGQQYVGSASGQNGIWGRWASYARTGHGGNKFLRELLEQNPERIVDLQFTVLRTLPRDLTKNEVIAHEALFKKKLGTRAFGLNTN